MMKLLFFHIRDLKKAKFDLRKDISMYFSILISNVKLTKLKITFTKSKFKR